MATASCDTLRLAGHEASGYYLVNGIDKFEVVNCNMGLESDDPQLQGSTGLKLPAHPVAFDALRPKSNEGGVITFDSMTTNLGQAFNSETGVFTAPVDGVYHFSLSSVPRVQEAQSYVFLRVNGASGFLYLSQDGPIVSGGEHT